MLLSREALLQYSSDSTQGRIITILLADDHPLMRQALRYAIEKRGDLQVVAEVDNGEDAIKVTTELAPDLVIMDISMPKLDGLEATRQIKERCPNVAILILTVHDDSDHVLRILEAGASGYLTKSVFDEEVIQAIRGVATGETVLAASISQKVIKRALRLTTKPLPLGVGETLSKREIQILRLLGRGMSNNDIAETLCVRSSTVKAYLGDIFPKLAVASRTEAVVKCLRAGIITIDDLE